MDELTSAISLPDGLQAIVDAGEWERLMEMGTWRALVRPGRPTYANVFYQGNTVYLHQAVMGETPVGYTIDHIDRDGLNCVRSNLRFATHAQQQQNRMLHSNTSGYKGVFATPHGTFQARIWIDGKNRQLGNFDHIEDARDAYLVAAREKHGEFMPIELQEQAAHLER